MNNDIREAAETTLESLKAKSDTLRSEVPMLLESLSPEAMTEEMIRRDEFRNDCQRAYNAVKDHIMELEAVCRKLREIKADQSHDNKKLEAHKWDLLSERKHSNV